LFDGTQGEGQDTTENALCFLENMEKTRNNYAPNNGKKTKKTQFYDDEAAEKATASRSGGSQSRDSNQDGGYNSESEASDDGEDVIIDLSPAKFENPKD